MSAFVAARLPATSRSTFGRTLALAAVIGMLVQGPTGAQQFDPAGGCATVGAQASLDRVSTAMLMWLTDVVSGLDGAPPRGLPTCIGSAPVDVALVPTIPVDDLRALLVPFYISSIPTNDPWGTPYEYRLNVANPLSAYAIALRSAGSDRLFEGTTYDVDTTPGPASDLVRYNGFPVREPPRLDPVSRQQQTAAQILNLGTAMLSWFTDVVSAAQRSPAGGPTVDLTLITPITAGDLATFLTPMYIQCVPEKDGWGHPFDLRLNDDLLGTPVMSIRSPGSDGVVEGDTYDTEVFPAEDFGRDLVWSDGQYFRSPSPIRAAVFADGFESATLWGTWSCGPGY